MRVRITLFFLLGWMVSTMAVAQTSSPASNTIEDEDIILEGNDKSKGLRSSYIPITATLSNGTIYIDFEAAIGNLTITISKHNEKLYISPIYVDQPAQITIDVDGYDPGIYLLEFLKPGGGYIYGYFTLVE